MEIYKNKLPPGLSYALKPSLLQSTLERHSITLPTSLFQWAKADLWGERHLFGAAFLPPGQPGFRNEGEVLHICSHAVPRSQRQDAMRQLEDAVLPEFVLWITNILAEPDGSTIRREQQVFERLLDQKG